MTSVLSKLDPRMLDRAAVTVSLAVVAEVSPHQLDLPTPCADSAGDRWLGLAGRDPQWSAR